MQNVFSCKSYWNVTQFLLFALVVAVVTMSRYELVQSQTALLILLMPDTTKQDTPKTCSSAEPHLNIKQNDTQTQVVRIFVIKIICWPEWLQVASLYPPSSVILKRG